MYFIKVTTVLQYNNGLSKVKLKIFNNLSIMGVKLPWERHHNLVQNNFKCS